jgi:hypothetical protein
MLELGEEASWTVQQCHDIILLHASEWLGGVAFRGIRWSGRSGFGRNDINKYFSQLYPIRVLETFSELGGVMTSRSI